MIVHSSALLDRSLVVGIIGGIALVLVSAFSNRGPLVLPVYGILAIVLGLLSSRYEGLSFGDRLFAAWVALLVSSAALLFGTIVLSYQDRRRIAAMSPKEGTAPFVTEGERGRRRAARGMFVIGVIVGLGLLSAAIAFVSS